MNSRSDHTISRFILSILAFGGLLSLAVSVPIQEVGWLGYLKVFLKELGIVIFAVFGISLIYEVWLAKRYQKEFLSMLSDTVKEGESNGAVCAALGISRIFRSRYAFEREYPL